MSESNSFDSWSVSTPTLYRELRQQLRDERRAVLATIVDVEGSAYRRPGAKMLISAADENMGAITAGCLEEHVTDLAAEIRETGKPRVKTFDLMDNNEWGLGLGCNGVIDILLEPVDNSLKSALQSLTDREPSTVVTAVASTDAAVDVGDRTVFDADGERTPAAGRPGLPSDVVAEVESTATDLQDSSSVMTIDIERSDGTVSVFIDTVAPAPRLLLFGSQNDVIPVTRLAREVGFEVVVASARGQTSSKDFPHAHDVVVTHPTDLADHADERTYAVVMSHNLLDDRLGLESLLTASAVKYVGLMGPKERFDQMLEEFAEEGTSFMESQLDRVATPVGLNLGGGEPVQIALSVVAEVLAVHNDRDGGRLTNREGPIHDRVFRPLN